MHPFIAILLLALQTLDPLGSWLVAHYPIREQAPLSTGAAADFRSGSILADPDFLQRTYSNQKYARIWSACLLTHEAVHLREKTTREELPNAFTYICLDRLGAPAWMKDHIYGTLQDAVMLDGAAGLQLAATSKRPQPGATVTVTARLVDNYERPVSIAGHPVAWTALGGGTLETYVTPTDEDGRATVRFRAGQEPGRSHVILASSGRTLKGSVTLTIAP